MDNSKKRRELTEQDRYLIEKCLKQGNSKSSIAQLLGVAPKTISREVQRGRKSSHEQHCVLIKEIREQLYKGWSPGAIAGRRKHGEETVCTKTIYNWIEQGRINGFTHKRKARKAAIHTVGYKNPTAKRIDAARGQ